MANNEDRSNHIYNHGPYRSDDGDYSRDFAQRAGGGGHEWGGGLAGGYGRSGDYGHEGGRGDFGGANAGIPADREAVNYSGRGPKGYRRADESIEDDICQALARNPDIDASEIEVTIENGEVTLRGTVYGRQMKRLAEDIAAECRGVVDVNNELRAERGRDMTADKPGLDRDVTRDAQRDDVGGF
jgi:hypothetical protein